MDNKDLVARLEAAERSQPSVISRKQCLSVANYDVRKALKCKESAWNSFDVVDTRLEELESGRGSILAEAAPATLYEFWLDVPGYSGPVKGARASLTQHGDIRQVSDVKGSTKGGLGGAAVGGLIFGPIGAVVGAVVRRKTSVKTDISEVDTRQFELEIVGPGFAWSMVRNPEEVANLRKFRDLLNARGSHKEDVKTLVQRQAGIVDNKRTEAKHAETTYKSTIEVAERERATYDQVWNDYLTLRLPLLLDIRARWIRSSRLRRFFAVLIGPVALVLWVTYFLIAMSYADLKPGIVAVTVGGVHIAALVGIVMYYISRVRLMK